MLTKLFISGKNWKLSLAEIAAYLNAKEIKFSVNFFSKEFFAIDLKQDAERRHRRFRGNNKNW